MIDTKDCWMRGRCKKAECGDFCIKLFKMDSLYGEALMTTTQRYHTDLRIDEGGTDRDAFKRLKNIENDIDNFVISGSNLYLHSCISGNGKTAWALRLMQSYFDTIWHKSELTCRGLFINVPRFLLTLKENISHESEYISHINDNVLSADIVIWDEVGVKTLTPFEHENLLSLINARLDDGKSNIYTSNLSPDELLDRVGDRLYSRIVNLSTNIELTGQDKRANMLG